MIEITAALDGLEKICARVHRGGGFARTSSNVAVLGQSFGGAAAVACCARDARFSHCCIYDPWLDGVGPRRHPLPDADYQGKFFPALKRLALWSCGASPLLQSCGANWDALLAKAGGVGVRHHEAEAGHFAQTDAPIVFEQGPLSSIYSALVSKADQSSDSETLLRKCLEQTVAELSSLYA